MGDSATRAAVSDRTASEPEHGTYGLGCKAQACWILSEVFYQPLGKGAFGSRDVVLLLATHNMGKPEFLQISLVVSLLANSRVA